MHALKIKFEVAEEDNYKPEFVEKIMKSKKQITEGKYTDVNGNKLKTFMDSL